jgi:hypothetical protein
MANVNRPNGFRAVKTFSGVPLNSVVRTIGVTDGTDLFIGDALTLVSGLAAQASTGAGATPLLGVAVGFGKVDADGIPLGPFNPDDLGKRFYDDSASTHTEWVVYYVPFEDVIFEAQFNATASVDGILPGVDVDIAATPVGSETTGNSGMVLDGATGGTDLIIVGSPHYPDNDPALAYGRVWVTAKAADKALHA